MLRSVRTTILGLLALSTAVNAQTTAPPAGSAASAPLSAAAERGPPSVVADVFRRRNTGFDPAALPRRFVTQHRAVIGGRQLRYTATAGETFITNLAGDPIASIFSFAYVKDGPREPGRPVTFVFNGGPGSSSVWLHMGIIGPQRLVLDSEVNPTSVPPFGRAANPNSILDVTDIVFIDPVGTGFSHAVGNASDADFAGVDEDAESVARFIETWLTANGRFNSPKYVMGESYGTVRAAVLPRALMGGVNYSGVMRGITLDGVFLISSSIGGGSSIRQAPDAERSAQMSLPSMAAAAWYHGRVDRRGMTVSQYYAAANAFATTDYAAALARLKAGQLSDDQKSALAAQLGAWTGVSAETWKAREFMIPIMNFLPLLLGERGLAIGAYDGRYTLPSEPNGGDVVADDAAMGRYVPGFIASFHDMIADDLNVKMPFPYGSIVWEGIFSQWRNQGRRGVAPDQTYGKDLAIAMRRNPSLRVMVANGYYDMLATPNGAEEQVAKAGLPRDRVTLRSYESGHMLYLGETAEAFSRDVRDFIRAGTRGK